MKIIALLITITGFAISLSAQEADKGIVKRKLGIEISKYQKSKQSQTGIAVALELQDKGEKLISGLLIMENEKRSAELSIKGEVKNNVLHFTFTDSTSGATGNGVVFGNTETTLKIKFLKFSNYGDGSTAALFTTHTIEKKATEEIPAEIPVKP